MLGSLAVSLFRTYVPLVVGAVVAVGAAIGLDVDSEPVLAVLATVASAVYYTAVRWLEEKVSPTLGYLLGIAEKPIYVRQEAVTSTPTAVPGEGGAD